MKMSDVFDLPVKPSQLEVYGANSNEGISFDEIESAAAHAINNHDRLTEENAKLRQMLKYAVNVANNQNATYTAIEVMNIEVQQLLNQLKDQSNDK